MTSRRILIVFAAIALAVCGGAVLLAFSKFRQVAERPALAMRALMEGDGQLFRQQATGPAAEASGGDLVDFSKRLVARFGALQRVEHAYGRSAEAPAKGPNGDRMEAFVDLVFDKGTVPARFLLEAPPGSWQGLLDGRIVSITVEPPDGAAIVFPSRP